MWVGRGIDKYRGGMISKIAGEHFQRGVWIYEREGGCRKIATEGVCLQKDWGYTSLTSDRLI